MDDASPRGPARHANGRFGPGNPGRRLGSRNRMSERVALGMLRHFVKNEAQILHTLSCGHYLPVYGRLLGALLPQGPGGDTADLDALAPEDAAQVIGAVRAALKRVEAGRGSFAEVDAALAGVDEGENPPHLRGIYGGRTAPEEPG